MQRNAEKRALVVGVSGIVGYATAKLLADEGWDVLGIARKPRAPEGVRTQSLDLLDASAVQRFLKDISVTHVFFCTWSREDTEEQNIIVNGAMLENLLAALSSQTELKHVALVTGTRHYLGTFEAGQAEVETPFREDGPLLKTDHFYYVWEKALHQHGAAQGFTWSVHRPQPVIGFAVGNAMNTAASIAVYAAICKEFNKPFVYPGSQFHWDNITDVSDARQIARQLAWAASNPLSAGQAYNVVNGDVFRWRWLWAEIANYFGLAPLPPTSPPSPLEVSMVDAQDLWSRIVDHYRLKERDIQKLTTWWFADWDLGRDVSAITDMSKSRRHGFTGYQYTPDSFFSVFDEMRAEGLIP
jgi:nucleoside-diphosphate-sugar epimerase